MYMISASVRPDSFFLAGARTDGAGCCCWALAWAMDNIIAWVIIHAFIVLEQIISGLHCIIVYICGFCFEE